MWGLGYELHMFLKQIIMDREEGEYEEMFLEYPFQLMKMGEG